MQGSPIGHLSYGHAVSGSGSLLLASHARINQLTLKVCLDPVNCLVHRNVPSQPLPNGGRISLTLTSIDKHQQKQSRSVPCMSGSGRCVWSFDSCQICLSLTAAFAGFVFARVRAMRSCRVQSCRPAAQLPERDSRCLWLCLVSSAI